MSNIFCILNIYFPSKKLNPRRFKKRKQFKRIGSVNISNRQEKITKQFNDSIVELIAENYQ